MKITELYIYPIKSLAPISVPRARLRREGVEYDRRFMLLKKEPEPKPGPGSGSGSGSRAAKYKNIQIVRFPECALFHQRLDLDAGEVEVTYHVPTPPLFEPVVAEQRTALRVPLSPDISGTGTGKGEGEVIDVDLVGSPTVAYRMGDRYDAWFSACFGYDVVLVYIGDRARDVLAHKPSQHRLWGDPLSQQQQKQGQGQGQGQGEGKGGWMSTISSYITGMGGPNGEKDSKTAAQTKSSEWLAFNEIAPYLVTSKASLRDVSRRLPDGEEMDMRRFRPNIVVDGLRHSGSGKGDDEEESGEGVLEAWDEDFWAELTVVTKGGESEKSLRHRHRHRLALTANCGRCMSINVDYDQGRPSEGEPGQVLKKLMADRRVDPGNKYSPIFGRYAFIAPRGHDDGNDRDGGSGGSGDSGDSGDDNDDDNVVEVAVGDEIHVTKRLEQRDTWAWPRLGNNGSA